MANLQVKNVPERIHARLRRLAKKRGRTLRDIVLEAIDRELSDEDFSARLSTRSEVKLPKPAAVLLEEAREERLHWR